jgi:hypothetical protein
LTGGEANIAAIANLSQKRVDERGLTNTSLTGNKHDLPFTLQCSLKHVLELSQLCLTSLTSHDT